MAVLSTQALGAGLFALALALLGRWPLFSWSQLPLGILLAVVALTSLLLLYRALALGPIAVVSPIGGAYVAVAVILIVVSLGERLTAGQSAAIALAALGVVLTAADGRSVGRFLARPSLGVWLALAAMVGSGGWAALMAHASRVQDGFATILLQRGLTVVILLVIFVAVRRNVRTPINSATVALIAVTGTCDTLANVLYVLGVQSGLASIVATASGAYPVVPALLAITVQGERMAPNQYLGMGVLTAGLVGLAIVS